MSAREHDSPFLSCQICFEVYDSECHQPKLLPCHHGYCKQCIAELVSHHKHFQCPTCRRKIELPRGGVDDLQTNFYVEDIGKILDSVSPETCKTHPGQALVSFCASCQVALCYECTRTEHKESKQHVHRSINDVRVDLEQKIREKLVIISEEAKNTHQGLTHLAKCKEQLLHDKLRAEQEIDLRYREAAKEILAAIKARWLAVKKENEEMYQSKIIELTTQIKNCEEKLLSLENITEAFNSAVRDRKHSSVLNIASKHGALYSVDNLLKKETFSKTVPKLRFNEGIWLYAAKQLLRSAGQMLKENQLGVVVPPEKMDITTHPKPGLVCSVSFHLSKKADVSIFIEDSVDDPIDYSLDQQGKFFGVQFIPQMAGAHHMVIKHGGSVIQGGDITINVESNDPLLIVNSTLNVAASFHRPRCVALDGQMNIYVADMGNNCVKKLNISAGYSSINFCNTPSFDIAIDCLANELLCTKVRTDQSQTGWSNAVEIYSLDGTLQSIIENQLASRSLWVAVNSRHHILTSDSNEHVIFVHNRQGKLLKTIGRQGSKVGKFSGPAGICIGPNDDIIIADRGNKRVQILDSEGQFKTQIGCAGTGKGEFLCPISVAVDRQNMIIVSDWKCNKIQIFKYDGTFVACIDSSGDILNGPTGMALTNDGEVFVADCKNHCVKKYRYQDSPGKSLIPDQCCVS